MAVALPGNRIPHSQLGTGVWAPACSQAGATQALSCLPASTIHTAPTESLETRHLCHSQGFHIPALPIHPSSKPQPAPACPCLCPGLTPTVMVTFTVLFSGGSPWSYTITVTTICALSSSNASQSSGSMLCISPVSALMVKLLLYGPCRILKPNLLLGLPDSSLSMA